MPQDFESIWQARLKASLEREVGAEAGSCVLQACGTPEHVGAAEWTRRALTALAALASPPASRAVLAGCACRYPAEQLAHIRARFAASGDLESAHRLLQEQYLEFLRSDLGLDSRVVDFAVANGWGLAGTLKGTVVEATKMPKSSTLLEYLEATEPDRRRGLYCHCPRIRQALASGERIPPDYCYCGAGFYQSLWEEILGRPVAVLVLTSVAAGDDACRIRIDLSPQVG